MRVNWEYELLDWESEEDIRFVFFYIKRERVGLFFNIGDNSFY